MVKKNSICTLCSAMIMLLLPWCAVTFAKGGSGMAICILLFFAVDPVAAICVGVFAGRKLSAAWFQPLLLSALFLLGTWVFFDMGDRAFLFYAAIYLLLGYAAAAIAAFLGRKKDRKIPVCHATWKAPSDEGAVERSETEGEIHRHGR